MKDNHFKVRLKTAYDFSWRLPRHTTAIKHRKNHISRGILRTSETPVRIISRNTGKTLEELYEKTVLGKQVWNVKSRENRTRSEGCFLAIFRRFRFITPHSPHTLYKCILRGLPLKDYIEERAISIANYIVDHNAMVRQTAREFGVSKSTVHTVVAKQNG